VTAIAVVFAALIGAWVVVLRRGIDRRHRMVAIRDARLSRRLRHSVRFSGYDETKVVARLRRERGQAAHARAKATRALAEIAHARATEPIDNIRHMCVVKGRN